MEWKESEYDEKDWARIKWITILSCDPAYADRVAREKTIIVASEHAGQIEQTMFSMRDGRLLLKRLVFAMTVNGNKLATELFEKYFENAAGDEEENENNRKDDDPA